MASKQADELKTLYKGWVAAMEADPEMSLDELRRRFEHWGDVTAEPGGVDYVEADAGGVPALWATPKGCAETRVLLCAHGGGYAVASMYTHRKVYAHVAKAIGCCALIVNYRRAPEHIHPGPVDDMVTAYQWLLRKGIDPKHIALIGDWPAADLPSRQSYGPATRASRCRRRRCRCRRGWIWRPAVRHSTPTGRRTCW